MKNKFAIKVLIFREEGYWIAQCLEYDILSQATTLKEVIQKLRMNILANAIICKHFGREPLQGLKPAPRKFWDMYKKADISANDDLQHVSAADVVMPEFIPAYKINENNNRDF